MKNLLPVAIILALSPVSALSIQTRNTGLLKGRVVDVAGMPIPKVRITIQSSMNSFDMTSNEDGYFEIEVPAGSYQINSDKLPGFAATRRAGVRVEMGKIVEVSIVPAVSSEGVLCSLYVTNAPLKKQKGRKRRR